MSEAHCHRGLEAKGLPRLSAAQAQLLMTDWMNDVGKPLPANLIHLTEQRQPAQPASGWSSGGGGWTGKGKGREPHAAGWLDPCQPMGPPLPVAGPRTPPLGPKRKPRPRPLLSPETRAAAAAEPAEPATLPALELPPTEEAAQGTAGAGAELPELALPPPASAPPAADLAPAAAAAQLSAPVTPVCVQAPLQQPRDRGPAPRAPSGWRSQAAGPNLDLPTLAVGQQGQAPAHCPDAPSPSDVPLPCFRLGGAAPASGQGEAAASSTDRRPRRSESSAGGRKRKKRSVSPARSPARKEEVTGKSGKKGKKVKNTSPEPAKQHKKRDKKGSPPQKRKQA